MVWVKSVVSSTVITLLALIFNSDLESIIPIKVKYFLVIAFIITLILSSFIQISYDYYKKFLELKLIAKKGKEIKLKKETQDFYKKFIEEPTRVVYPPIDVDELKKGTQVYDFEGVIDLKDFFMSELGISLPGMKSDLVSEEQKRQNNLICVGGPIPNEITCELLPKDEIAYKFKGHNIIDVSNNVQICGFDKVFDEDEIPKEDYGIITRMKNPYNPKKDAMILCGCLGWGTKACINVLLDEENMQQLRQHGYFQVLTICNIDAKGVVHSARLKKDSLKAINY